MAYKPKTYFAEQQKAVVKWWNPEQGFTAATYQEGLLKAVRILQNNLPRNALILDAACGKGRATNELARHFRVTACDISKEMLFEVTRLNLSGVETVQADVGALPFSDNSFDAIVCLEAFVHFQDTKKTLSEFYRVLKHGGTLIFNIDNSHGAIRMAKEFINFFVSIVDKNYREERAKRKAIFHTLNPRHVQKEIIAANFILFNIFYTGFIMPFTLKDAIVVSERFYNFLQPLDRVLRKIPLIRMLSTYVFFVCQRPL